MNSDTAGLRRQATNGNCDEKWSWNPDISRRRLDGTFFAIQNISDFVYKSSSFKQNSKLFMFSSGLHVDFTRVDWVEAKFVFTVGSNPLVTVTDRIQSANYESKYYIFLKLFTSFGMIWLEAHP